MMVRGIGQLGDRVHQRDPFANDPVQKCVVPHDAPIELVEP